MQEIKDRAASLAGLALERDAIYLYDRLAAIEKVVLIWIGDCLVLLADDLHQGYKVDVVLLADWNVDK